MSLSVSELIHPTAVIRPEAEIAPDVQVGPYTIVEGPVRIESGLRGRESCLPLRPHGHGPRQLRGPRCRPGQEPAAQGYQRRGDVVADRRRQRLSRARDGPPRDPAWDRGRPDRRSQPVHDRLHIGHDARVGNGCTLVNGALLAGHVTCTTVASSRGTRPSSSASGSAGWPCSAVWVLPRRTSLPSCSSKVTTVSPA